MLDHSCSQSPLGDAFPRLTAPKDMIKHDGDYLDATCPFMYPILEIHPTISAQVDSIPSNASIDPFSRTHVTRFHLALSVYRIAMD